MAVRHSPVWVCDILASEMRGPNDWLVSSHVLPVVMTAVVDAIL